MLQVKEIEIPGSYMYGYGITDGEKWFFYGYKTREQAEAILPQFNTPERVRVNISYTQPYQVIDLTKGTEDGMATYLCDVVTSNGVRTMYVDLPKYNHWSGIAHPYYIGHLDGVGGVQRGRLRDMESNPEARAAYMLARGELTDEKVGGWRLPFNPEKEDILASSDDETYIRALCVYLSEYTMLDHYGIRVCERLPKEQMPDLYKHEGAYMVVCRTGSRQYSQTWEKMYEGKEFFRKGWDSAMAATKAATEEVARQVHIAKHTPRSRKRKVA